MSELCNKTWSWPKTKISMSLSNFNFLMTLFRCGNDEETGNRKYSEHENIVS